MSERGLFAVIGFDDEAGAREFKHTVDSLKCTTKEIDGQSHKLKNPNHFIDSLESVNQYGAIVMAEWVAGRSLDGSGIRADLKSFSPKYLTTEEWEDGSRLKTTGYSKGKTAPYSKVINSLRNSSPEVAYSMALRAEQSAKIIECLKAGVDPHASYMGENVLLFQDYGGRSKVILTLIAAGANPNAQSIDESYGETPLHMAAECGKLDVVAALVEAGADVNRLSLHPRHLAPPLFNALGSSPKARKIAKLLVDAGADINAVDADGRTALLNAVWWYSDTSPLSVVKFLFDEGADIEYFHERWGNALWSAEENQFENCIKYFQGKGLESKPPVAREPRPLPASPAVLEKLQFLEDHEERSAEYAKQVSAGESYWPSDDKDWLQERREVWKFYDNSIRHWFMGNIKSKQITELKHYFLHGKELSSNIGSYAPLFATWLHTSRDDRVLRELIDWDTRKYNVGYYYFFAGIPFSQVGGREGPRNKYIAKLMYEFCFETEKDKPSNAIRFVKHYIRAVPQYLKTNNPYDKTQYLLPQFKKCLELLANGDINLIHDEEIGARTERNRFYQTSAIRHMFNRIENFTIDNVPEYKVESTCRFVADFRGLIDEGVCKALAMREGAYK